MRRLLLATATLFANSPGFAHDMWLLPLPLHADAGDAVRVTPNLGPPGEVEVLRFDARRIDRLYARDAAGEHALKADGGPAGTTMPPSGTLAVAYVSTPAHSELPAEKFDEYLHEEHLDNIIALRAAQGGDAMQTEDYRRSLKALVRANGTPLQDCMLGLPLEITILEANADTLRVKATENGAPVENLWVDLADARSNTHEEHATNADGIATFKSREGTSVLRATQMKAAPAGAASMWESVWTSTTFALDERGAVACATP